MIKAVLIIFNGQTDVERGFSQNAAMMVTNLSDISTISKKLIIDHMHANSINPVVSDTECICQTNREEKKTLNI